MHNYINCGRRHVVALAVAMIGIGLHAQDLVPSIKIESVRQRWPWNNKVDIQYSVANCGEDAANNVFRKIVFTATVDGKNITIDGAAVGASAKDGTHSVIWYAPKGIKPTAFSLKAELHEGTVPSGDDYMVVDLTTGKVTYEGIWGTQGASNERYSKAEYKTTKMAFRKVKKGTYTIGLSKSHEMWSAFGVLVSSEHEQTLSHDYYIAVFECTRTQWSNIFGGDYDKNVFSYFNDYNGDIGAHRAAHQISWDMLRGSAARPSDKLTPNAKGTVLERLNAKTLAKSSISGFDLPTEVMFEIACRAGKSTLFFWGDDVSEYADYVVCMESVKEWSSANPDRPRAVGSLKPNDWGLYDMSGNVWEWCLDDTSRSDVANTSTPFVPADNGTSIYMRMHGGGPYNNDITGSNKRQFACAFRNSLIRTDTNLTRGFRISWIRW